MALFIMVIVLSGAANANFAAQYWSITSETSGEALFKTKTKLENLRALAKEDFYQATSSPFLPDACVSGQLCYYVQNTVTDISSCFKYGKMETRWQIDRYPTTTIELFTNFANIPETILEGGDCLLAPPLGNWTGISASSTADIPGNPTGIDVLNGNVYLTGDQPPWLAVKSAASTVFTNTCTGCTGPYNALDVARDPSTGRTYAYVAATTTRQFQIIDVTDGNPNLVASSSLSGVAGTNPQGFRIAYYGQKAYITTLRTAGNEFHIFDVIEKNAPVEVGKIELNSSTNALVIREQISDGTMHRFAYLATDNDTKEIMILDVTNPASIAPPISFNLPESGCTLINSPDATVLALLGTTLWIGRKHSPSCPAVATLYALDVSNPFIPNIRLEISTGATITGLKVSGNKAYLEHSNTVAPPSTGLLDIDGDSVYAARSLKNIEVWNVDPMDVRKLSSYSPLSHSLQIFYAP